jgi:hypothetical protein
MQPEYVRDHTHPMAPRYRAPLEVYRGWGLVLEKTALPSIHEWRVIFIDPYGMYAEACDATPSPHEAFALARYSLDRGLAPRGGPMPKDPFHLYLEVPGYFILLGRYASMDGIERSVWAKWSWEVLDRRGTPVLEDKYLSVWMGRADNKRGLSLVRRYSCAAMEKVLYD